MGIISHHNSLISLSQATNAVMNTNHSTRHLRQLIRLGFSYNM